MLSQAGARSGLKLLRASVLCNSCCPPSRNSCRLLGALCSARSLPWAFHPSPQHSQDLLWHFSQVPAIPCAPSCFASWSFGVLSAFFPGSGIPFPLVFLFCQHKCCNWFFFYYKSSLILYFQTSGRAPRPLWQPPKCNELHQSLLWILKHGMQNYKN